MLGGDDDLHRLNYDSLVIALGGETATFGIKGIDEYAVGMKTLADAFALRNRIIEMLERADLEERPRRAGGAAHLRHRRRRILRASRRPARSRTSSAACGGATTRRSARTS